MNLPTTRRAVLGAAGLVPFAALAETSRLVAVSAASPDLETLIARYKDAERVYNATPAIESDPAEKAYIDAVRALDAYEPRTPHEFVRAFSVRFSNDLLPNDDDFSLLVEQARKLAGVA